jgi:hypothetical protein
MQAYGNITPIDIEDNDRKFKTPYDPSTPIQLLYAQIEDAMEFADAGNTPYTQEQILANAYYLIFATGMYAEACKEWRRLPAIQKTWARFQQHFTEAYNDMIVSQKTTQAGGYHNANAAMEAYVATTSDALANLASAQQHNTEIILQQEATINTLKAEIKQKDAIIAGLLKQPARQSKSKQQRQGRQQQQPPRIYNNDNYCWSHGYNVHDSHDSSTCRTCLPGHQHAATRANTMGGSQANKDMKA